MGELFFSLVFFQSSRNFEKFNSSGIWRPKDLLISWKIRRNAILEWKRYIPNLLQEEIVKIVVFRVVHFYTTSFFEFFFILPKANSGSKIRTERMKLPAKGLTLKDSHCSLTNLAVQPTQICNLHQNSLTAK